MSDRPQWGLRNAAPLVDLLFLLLFGLLALSDSRSSSSEEVVRVRLPRVEPETEQGTDDQDTITIEIDRDSKVRLDGNDDVLVGPAALDAAMAKVLGDRLPEQLEVEIRGDAGARHGVAVSLLQHLRRRGFAGVRLLALGAEGNGQEWDGAEGPPR